MPEQLSSPPPQEASPTKPFDNLVEQKEKLTNKHYDALIVLGKNWRSKNQREQGAQARLPEGMLSLESKMAAIAAGMELLAGRTDRLIFSGGETAGTDWPSEASAMHNFMNQIFTDSEGQPLIPRKKVTVEEISLDTTENAVEIKRILKNDYPDLNQQNFAYMSVGYHIPRAEKNFCPARTCRRLARLSRYFASPRSPVQGITRSIRA